mmetsp:Transcript_50236/g.155507  ORF Transcript_50236/g.155507 Transcript_50236/m.155507 type:complete len:276 (-) Transcript_50236:209-1036(-)
MQSVARSEAAWPRCSPLRPPNSWPSSAAQGGRPPSPVLLQALEHRPPIPVRAEGRKLFRKLPAGLVEVLPAGRPEDELRGHVPVPRLRHGGDEPWALHQRVRQHGSVPRGGVGERLAQHHASVGVLAQAWALMRKLPGEVPPVALDAVLEHVLHHVVAVTVRGELQAIREECLGEAVQLPRGEVLQEALEHAAGVGVPRRLAHGRNAPALDLLDDEAAGPRRHPGDATLQNVVGVWALHRLPDVAPELRGQGTTRVIAVGNLQGVLDHAATVPVT